MTNFDDDHVWSGESSENASTVSRPTLARQVLVVVRACHPGRVHARKDTHRNLKPKRKPVMNCFLRNTWTLIRAGRMPKARTRSVKILIIIMGYHTALLLRHASGLYTHTLGSRHWNARTKTDANAHNPISGSIGTNLRLSHSLARQRIKLCQDTHIDPQN